jgi:hypothetical protein
LLKLLRTRKKQMQRGQVRLPTKTKREKWSPREAQRQMSRWLRRKILTKNKRRVGTMTRKMTRKRKRPRKARRVKMRKMTRIRVARERNLER